MKKICHVCSAHEVDDGRVFYRACKTLAESGYEVHLIGREARTSSFEAGKVIVHALEVPQSRRMRISERSKIARIAKDLNPDLYHVHEPELLGPILSFARTAPVVWDVHESYLEVISDRAWIPRPLRPLTRLSWDVLERYLLTKCAGVVAATDQVAQRYLSLHDRVVVVANYPSLDGHGCTERPNRDGKTCIFTGGIAYNRGLHNVIKALSILKARKLAVTLQLAGTGGSYLDELFKEARRSGVENQVLYLGFLSREEVLTLQRRASIGLVPHLPYGNNLAAWPVKMLEFMAAGIPVIYTDCPSHNNIVRGDKIGVAVDPTKPSALADAIEYLVRNQAEAEEMGRRGAVVIAERLNWERESKKLLDLYSDLLS